MKIKGAPSGKKQTKKTAKKTAKKTDDKVQKAEKAVEKFEEMRGQLLDMKVDFEEEFPEAEAALQDIRTHEDAVQEQIAACKVLVRGAEQTIGDFSYTRRATTAGYVGAKILELLSALSDEEAGELVKELFTRGVVEDVKVNKAAAQVIRASDEDLRETLDPAWDNGGQPLTAAVGTPKI